MNNEISDKNTVLESPAPVRGGWRPTLPPALQYPAYRNFWLSLFTAVGGFQILMFGQGWLVHELTGSPLFLGYVGAANALPAICLNLFGGAVADKADKKRLIVVTQTMSSSLVFLLGFLTLFHVVRVWHVMVIAVLAGAINAFNQPARQALYPHLLERKALMSAVALNSAVWQGTRIIAPGIAGMLIALFGTSSPFFAAGAGMLAFAIVVHRLDVPKIESSATGRPLHDLAEGLKFIKNNSIFSFLILMTFFNSFFGMAYVNQMPVFAKDILKVGAEGQGVLLSVSGAGSLIITLILGTIGNFKHKGPVLIGGAVMTGLSVAGFSLTARFVGSYPLAGCFMFAIGAFTSTYMISIMNSLQMMVPDDMRGRVMGFYGMTWSIMPLGGMYAGALAGVIGTPFAIAIGGILVSVFAIGPALVNRRVRHIGTTLTEIEARASA
ncbi:MAG: MFS transporter [Deltaproteobacteria bacterium]|nr:MFS transporter [Deltaproteobacteria bacterium]